MFLARAEVELNSGDTVDLSAKGLTLKIAYDDLKEMVKEMANDVSDFDDSDIEFFEGEMIQVEFQITKKTVVIATPKAKPAPLARKK